MSILVTGATGFVGSCLTRRLVELNYDVHIFTRGHSNRWRIADLWGRVKSHEVDLRDAGAVKKAVGKISPTVIYHLAAYGGFSFQKDTPAILESNLMGTVNLLRACEKIKFDYFINTGSSSEYGIKSAPMSEKDMLLPVGDYGVSKAAATMFCQSIALEKGLPVITLRLFSPYGPWDDPHRLIPYVITSLLRGEAPKLSTPKSVRDFIYIDDVLDIFLKVIKVPGSGGKVFNVGSGVQVSVGTVASMITKSIGGNLEPLWGEVPSQRPEPDCWVAQIGKAIYQLGWFPSVSLRAGLKRTIEWMRNNLELYP